MRDWASMAYSISEAYVPATLMEQVLIQYKVPFDLLFDEQFDLLSGYKAVIFAGQECLSDAQEESLLRYVRGGGVLLLTSDTAKYGAWREKRRKTSLLPARAEGKGNIVLLPTIVADETAMGRGAEGNFFDPEPGATVRRGVQMAPPQWVLPKNHKDLYETVVGNVPGGFCVQTDAPLTTVMEVLKRPSTQETILHFVNFKQDALAPFAVHVSNVTFPKIKSAMLFLPEQDEPIRLEMTVKGEATSVSLPKMKTYGMLVFAHG